MFDVLMKPSERHQNPDSRNGDITHISLRIEKALLARLRILAKGNRRSVSSQILSVLDGAVADVPLPVEPTNNKRLEGDKPSNNVPRTARLTF